jgi:GR25 family glycosyltransferase involved in LPS biosynthesis
MEIPTYVINLAHDTERMSYIEEQLSKYAFIETIRVEGFLGSTLPDLACQLLTRNDWSQNFKGACGCFLSHIRIWELIARRGGWGLVIEDDAKIQNLENIRNLIIPEQTDIIFCNDRTAFPGKSGLRPILPAFEYAGRNNRGVGTDAYIITSDGANKCLKYLRKDGIFTHVDLRLMAYCLDTEEAELFSTISQTANNIYNLRRTYQPDHKLNGFSLSPPVSIHQVQFGSTRDDQDRTGLHANSD